MLTKDIVTDSIVNKMYSTIRLSRDSEFTHTGEGLGPIDYGTVYFQKFLKSIDCFSCEDDSISLSECFLLPFLIKAVSFPEQYLGNVSDKHGFCNRTALNWHPKPFD